MELNTFVGRPLKFPSTAGMNDALAFVFPDFTFLASSGRRRLVASVGLGPAVLGRLPAAGLGGVAGDLHTAPVGVHDQAIVRHELSSGLLATGRRDEGNLCRLGGLGGGGRGKHLGARHRVRPLGLVDVECHARLAGLDIAGDRNAVLSRDLQGTRVRTPNADLGTSGVELRVSLVGFVEGEKLGPEQIGARGEARGNSDRQETVIGDQLLCAPLARRFVVSLFPDLEPSRSGSRVAALELLSVDSARALVGDIDGAGLGQVRILAPLKTELRARVRLAFVLDRLESILACIRAGSVI